MFTAADLARFEAHVDASGGPDACHLWLGATHYATFKVAGRSQGAHRWRLGYAVGRQLLPGEQACHTCDNPPCVNPAHLYVGSSEDNARDRSQRRGATGGAAINAAKTHCPQGHEYSDDNLVPAEVAHQHRVCLTCQRERNRANQRRYRAARKAA